MDTGFLILLISCFSGFIYLTIGYLLTFNQKADVLNGIDFSKIADLPAFCKLSQFFISSFCEIPLIAHQTVHNCHDDKVQNDIHVQGG